MVDGQNIAREDVLFKIAGTLAQEHPASFDLALFQQDWKNGHGQQAFREDLKQARFHKIGRFPTLTMTDSSGKGVIIVGYRPYAALEQAFRQVYRETCAA
jgi:predicted DsbA family dithiol-disulfide isomerase